MAPVAVGAGVGLAVRLGVAVEVAPGVAFEVAPGTEAVADCAPAAALAAVTAVRADGGTAAGTADPGDAAADVPPGVAPSAGADASAVARSVWFRSPCAPSDDEVQATPASSAATDAAPIAPTAAARFLGRRP
ncbi:hypothetical protein MB828_24020, partial [Streptomyces arenae]|nr:hypothetical protein [Streptomyces arenae]